MGQIGYDSSGQVYTETLVQVKHSNFSWPSKSRGRAAEFAHSCRAGPGATSLYDMALHSFLANSGTVTASTLVGLPWTHAAKLWDAVHRHQLDSVQIWQAFTSAFPDSPSKSGLKRKTKRLSDAQDLPLQVFLAPMQSITPDWLTVLTLQGLRLDRGALIQGISRLTNLVVLTIDKGVTYGSGLGFDDGILRDWGRHVMENPTEKPLSMLRILNVVRQAQITNHCFEYLSMLPCLSILTFDRCSVEPQAMQFVDTFDWFCVATQALADVDSSTFFASHKSRMSWRALVKRILSLADIEDEAAKKVKELRALDSIPHLHLILGSDLGPADNLLRMSQRFNDTQTFVRATKKDERKDMGRKRHVRDPSLEANQLPRSRVVRGAKQQDIGDALAAFIT